MKTEEYHGGYIHGWHPIEGLSMVITTERCKNCGSKTRMPPWTKCGWCCLVWQAAWEDPACHPEAEHSPARAPGCYSETGPYPETLGDWWHVPTLHYNFRCGSSNTGVIVREVWTDTNWRIWYMPVASPKKKKNTLKLFYFFLFLSQPTFRSVIESQK